MNATTQPSEGARVRDAAELEREGDAIRADMGRTLNELERKFSPEQMMERSMSFLRENGSNLVEEIGTTVRNHPLPVLLTAAGLIWLTGSITQSRWKRSASAPAASDDATYSAADPESSSQSTQASTLNTVRGKVSASMRAVREREQRAAESFAGLVQEQPLALGALAVAAGALIGAALPMTRYENELLAQTQNGSASPETARI